MFQLNANILDEDVNEGKEKIPLIDKFMADDFKDFNKTFTKIEAKNELKATVKELIDNRKELLELKQNKNMLGGKKMDNTEMELFEGRIDKLLNTKFKTFDEKFDKGMDDLYEQLEKVEAKGEQGCKDGKCTMDKLNSLEETIGNIAEVISGDYINKISNLDEKISGLNGKMSGLDEKVEKVCTGVDCITNKFKEQDDTVICPGCGESFLLSQNMLGDKAICPNCGVQLNVS